MSKKFVIGDRLKDEWISVLDTEKKKLGYRQGVPERGRGQGEPKEDPGDRLFQRPADLHEGRQQGLQNRRARLLPVVKQQSPAEWLGICFSER